MNQLPPEFEILSRIADAKQRIEREAHVTDEQIDALVAFRELYGLTEEEIKVVERAK